VKPLAIVNPHAGGGRAGRMLPELTPILERALGSVDVALTTARGHAIALANEAARDRRELVIAMGGDGTLNEVASGVLDAGGDATAVGYLGLGTGGDFRRSLGIEHRLDKYLAALAGKRERRLDAARVVLHDEGREVSRWFVNVLSVGVGGLVDRYVETTSRALPPTLAYLAASLRALAESEPLSLSCTVHRGAEHEERRLDAYILAVANGAWFGAGMHVAPGASIADGQLDVVAISAHSRAALVNLGAKLYSGRHLGEPGVVSLRCDAIDLALAGGPPGRRALLDVDGEPLGELPARVTLAPGALRFRA
jgi:YegS/Rv2252/BmrU family lipid kinase